MGVEEEATRKIFPYYIFYKKTALLPA